MPTPPGGRDLFGGYPFFGPNGRASPMPTPLGGRDLLVGVGLGGGEGTSNPNNGGQGLAREPFMVFFAKGNICLLCLCSLPPPRQRCHARIDGSQ